MLFQHARYIYILMKRNLAVLITIAALLCVLSYGHVYISRTVNSARVKHEQIFRVTRLQNISVPKPATEKLHTVNFLGEEGKNVRYSTKGYERADFLRQACARIHDRHSYGSKMVRVSFDAKYKALYCPLCKLASTFWTRVFKMLEYNRIGVVTKHPYEVPISKAPASRLYFDLSTQKIARVIDARNSFRFLFVRNPYSMLFSTFVDKIIGPNPLYWKLFRQPHLNSTRNISRLCGSEVRFEQFLSTVIKQYKTKRSLDCHVAKFSACQPCRMNYTFVAKMETFKEDAFHLLSLFNQTQTLEVFESEFSDLHANDAIEDSTSGPYLWKNEITKCIPWYKALQRIWRKLQIRGVIGMEDFPLSDAEANNVSRADFVHILKKTRRKTTSSERMWQKEQAFYEAYKSVSSDVLNDIRKIYAQEFYLFNYDDSLQTLFDKDVSLHRYRFMEYK